MDRFYLDGDCTRRDPFRDDQALVIETAGGAVVLLGCAHAGVANTLSCALNQSRSGRLRAVVGGMHLGDAPQEEIVRLGDLLERLGPRLICPCHCTGAKAKEYFRSRFPDAYREGRAGTRLNFTNAA
jgi:7,8-dihydropterin-6-yl-methyl-4-(beta-D-ribofuranosyl)aminobenzene 5'-phosphate synthase